MKLLLDTHILLRAAAGTLKGKAARLVTDESNTLFFSPASIWEVGIKKGLGRQGFTVDPEVLRRALLDNQYQEIFITSAHVLAVCDLPMHHKDPFDRILLAQAKAEGISLVTSDDALRKYHGPVIFATNSSSETEGCIR